MSIRRIAPEEFDDLWGLILNAFGRPPDPESAERDRGTLEFERTLGVFDGSALVGSAGFYSFEMTVPGRTAPTAGVTFVSVLPTHRRRGLLTSLMRRQLDDLHEHGGEPVAALWASEAAIYGRFGYGLATYAYGATVPRASNRIRAVVGSDALRLRIVDGAEHVDDAVGVYDGDRVRRPGMLALNGPWRTRALVFPTPNRNGATPLRTVLAHTDDGTVRAYARYATRPGNDFGRATTVVRELHAVDPAATAAMLGFLLDLDLSAETSFWLRPADDPLLQLLVDFRAAGVTRSDGLNVRLVDVGAALAARTYAVPVDVVLEVDDAFCPWNARRWRLSGDRNGATCDATSDPADLSIGVRELGSVYLGGLSLRGLADAGLVREHTPGAVAALSLALQHERAPWSPFIF